MKQRTATILALCAVILGALVSLYQGAASTLNLARLGVPAVHLVMRFIGSNDWIGYGLIILFASILIYPQGHRLGAIGVILGALLRIFFSIGSLISILVTEAMVVLGAFRYFFFSGPVLAFITLLFGILWAVDPNGQAVRVAALIAGIGIALNGIMVVLINSFQPLTIISILISGLLAMWYIRFFIRGVSDPA